MESGRVIFNGLVSVHIDIRYIKYLNKEIKRTLARGLNRIMRTIWLGEDFNPRFRCLLAEGSDSSYEQWQTRSPFNINTIIEAVELLRNGYSFEVIRNNNDYNHVLNNITFNNNVHQNPLAVIMNLLFSDNDEIDHPNEDPEIPLIKKESDYEKYKSEMVLKDSTIDLTNVVGIMFVWATDVSTGVLTYYIILIKYNGPLVLKPKKKDNNNNNNDDDDRGVTVISSDMKSVSISTN